LKCITSWMSRYVALQQITSRDGFASSTSASCSASVHPSKSSTPHKLDTVGTLVQKPTINFFVHCRTLLYILLLSRAWSIVWSVAVLDVFDFSLLIRPSQYHVFLSTSSFPAFNFQLSTFNFQLSCIAHYIDILNCCPNYFQVHTVHIALREGR
jgi:hypothetical protein